MVLFEEECFKGQVTANIKFETFAKQWFDEYALANLRHTTYVRMKQLTVTRAYTPIPPKPISQSVHSKYHKL